MTGYESMLGGAAVAVLATVVGQLVFHIRPPGGWLGGFIVSYVSCALGRFLVPCPGWDVFIKDFCVVPSLAAVWIPWYWWRFVGVAAAAPDREVQLWWDGRGHKIQVFPRVARVNRTEKLTWVIDAKDGDQVDIEFAERMSGGRPLRGPFRARGGNENPNRGEYHKTGPGSVTTESLDNEEHDGGYFWPYTVAWRRGTDGDTIDPGVEPKG